MNIARYVLAPALCLVFTASAAASDPDTAGMKRAFDAVEKALRTAAEADFKQVWHPQGYATNLVGGSGLPGQRVFEQGSRKGWYFRPDMDRITSPGRGAPWVIPCDVWSWKKQRSVDGVHAVLVWHEKRWKILGAGEDKAEVMALARRWLDKKPLAPPASD